MAVLKFEPAVALTILLQTAEAYLEINSDEGILDEDESEAIQQAIDFYRGPSTTSAVPDGAEGSPQTGPGSVPE